MFFSHRFGAKPHLQHHRPQQLRESSSQSFLSESKLREAVAAFREGGERQEEPDLDEELEYTYELPSRGSEGHFEGRCSLDSFFS